MAALSDDVSWSLHLPSSATAADDLPPVSMGRTTRTGACLFLDMSGFSRLCARLTSQSERGAEEIEKLLRAHYDAIIPLIGQNGGSVAFIAGDAICATWLGDAATSCAGARAAAAAIRAITGPGRGVASEMLALPMRIGLDFGEITVNRVGGYAGEWVDLAAGPVIARLAELNRSASDAEVYETPFFAASARGAAAKPDPVKPSPVKGMALAEFRRASVLFARLDVAMTEDLAQLGGFVAATQAALADQNGTMLSLVCDDKGLVLIAAWGLAFAANENDAERALLVAETLFHGAKRGDYSIDLAVTTGDMFAGQIGNADYQRYSVLSASVNLAAALLARAEGGILCDAATVTAARRSYDFADAGRFLAKGEVADQPIFRPLGSRGQALAPKTGTPTPIFGRGAELAALLASQPGATVAVLADAGVGKSHLGQVVSERLQDTGEQVLFAVADSLRRATPYYAWRNVFDGLLARSGPLGDPDAATIAGLLPPGLHRRMALLNPVLRQPLPEAADAEVLSDAGRGQAARELMLTLLTALMPTSQPVTLVIDDAHWLDTASWNLLADCRRSFPHLRIIALSRPVPDSDLSPEALALLAATDRITLGPLTRDDLIDLVCEYLQVHDLPPVVAERLVDLSEGNALYARELAALLVETGQLRVEHGYCHVPVSANGLAPMAVKGGIRGLVTARIANLPFSAQNLLKCAAVQGRSVTASMLKRLAPGPELVPSLAALTAAGLLDPVGPGQYRFHHAIIMDTAYDLLLTDQRRELHRALAEAYSEEAEVRPALLAHHWDNAGDVPRALVWLERAAHGAAASQSHPETISFVSRAMTLAEGQSVGSGQLGNWHAMAYVACRSVGNYRQSEAHLDAVITLFDRAPAKTTARRILGVLAEFWRLKRARPGPVGATTSLPELQAARAHLFTGEIYYERQNTLAQLYHCLAGANLARRAGGNNDALARAEIGLAMIGVFVPWALKGDAYRASAVARLDGLDDTSTASWVLVVAGNYDFALGRWASAEATTEAGIRAARAAREIKNWEMGMANLGNILRVRGLFRRADALDVEVFASAHDRAVPQVLIWATKGRLQNLLALNEHATFKEVKDRARSLLSDKANQLNVAASNQIALSICLSLENLLQGRDEPAMEDVLIAKQLYASLRDPQVFLVDPLAFMLSANFILFKRRPDDPRVMEIARFMPGKCAAMARVYPMASARMGLARGDLAHMEGKPELAVRHWRQAVQDADSFDLPFDAAMAEHRLAGVLPAEAARLQASVVERLARIDIPLPDFWLI